MNLNTYLQPKYFIYKLLFLISSHLTSPHLTSPHLTSPHLTSPHLTSPHLTSPHLTSPHLTSPHLTSPHFISSYLVLSYPISSLSNSRTGEREQGEEPREMASFGERAHELAMGGGEIRQKCAILCETLLEVANEQRHRSPALCTTK